MFMNEVEEFFKDFIKRFVKQNKRERILQFLNKEKNWKKIINEFHSSNIFENKVLKEINPNKQDSESIYDILKTLGAEDECYSLLDYLENVESKWALLDKLEDSVGFTVETIIYCSKSKLGYYEGGHSKDRYILKA